MSVCVGPAPHEAERAEAHLVEAFQSAGERAEVLGAFEVEDRREHAFAQARLDLSSSPNYFELVFRLGLQVEQNPNQFVCLSPCIDRVKRRRIRDFVARLGQGERGLLGPAIILRVPNVAGEETAAEAPLPGARQVDVPDVAPLEEVPLLSALGEAELEQRVIVAVQYRYIRHPTDDTGPSKARKKGRSAAPLSIGAQT